MTTPQSRERLDTYEKRSIVKFREKGLTYSAIADLLDRSEGTVSSYYARQMAVVDLPEQLVTKKTKITAAMGVAIKRVVADNPKLGLKGMAAKLKEIIPNEAWYPSYKTLGRYLKNNGKVKVKYQLKPPLSEGNKIKRLEFANTWLRNGVDHTGNVLWTDETMVRSHHFTRRVSGYVDANTAPENYPV